MKAVHRLFGIELTSAVVIAGGAAGVSAAFNTPLAGVAFAIEELASAYEQRLAVLVMGAVMISGLVSLGLAGDYLYFGAMHEVVSLKAALVICPMAGIVGGVAGGLFSRAILAFGSTRLAPDRLAPHASRSPGRAPAGSRSRSPACSVPAPPGAQVTRRAQPWWKAARNRSGSDPPNSSSP